MRKYLVSILLVCCCVTVAFGYTIKKLNAENGLSNNNVISMTQDREGFVWMATKDGLNRFDGNRFQVFRHSETDANSLCSNVLNCVYADPTEDLVWIATEKNGLDAYYYKTRRFVHYNDEATGDSRLSSNGITHVTGDRQGLIWLATYSAGINCLNKKTGKVTVYNQANTPGLGSDYHWYVLPDNEGHVYVGHVGNGFSIIDLQTHRARNFVNDPANPASLSDNTVTCLFLDSRNRLWIGTRLGLNLWDRQTQSFIRFQHRAGDETSISNNFIKGILETPDHQLWVGTEGGGINILEHTQTLAFQQPVFRHIRSSFVPGDLSNASVQALIRDSYGNFWAGGFVGGVNFISTREEQFNRISYLPYIGNTQSLGSSIAQGLAIDADSRLWIANGTGGLYSYSVADKQLQKKPLNCSPSMILTALLQDPYQQDLLWMGTADGRLCMYHKATGAIQELALFPAVRNVMIYNMFMDSHRLLWVSTDIGLGRYDLASKQTSFFDTRNSPLGDDNIRSVAEDAEGNIWVGTLGGHLQVFDIRMKLLYNLSRKADFYGIAQIVRNSRNRMWVASQNDFFVFTRPAAPFVRIGKKDGLAENTLIALAEGTTPDEVWMSSTNYISYLNLRTMKVKNYGVADGIAAGDYVKSVVATAKDGTLFFGSQNGITWFNSRINEKSHIQLQARISGFMITDKQKQYLADFVDYPYADKVELNYTQNTFQISFNVPDYSLNNQAEFMYQLSGLDDGWYYIGKEKQLTFRNLRPGTYVFQLKARLQNKEWSTRITRMTVVVNPPFWLSWWAKLLYIFASAGVLYFVLHFYKNKLLLENSLLLEKQNHQQEQKLNEEKMRFFTNIAHELRTPMTLIIGPLEDMIADQSVPPALAKKIHSIHRVANRLLSLINQILEFRRTETNNRVLKVSKKGLIPLVYEIGLRYKELHQKKDVSFEINLPKSHSDLYFDAEVLTIILDNLISNAFKYTREGSIRLTLSGLEEAGLHYTLIEITDTGIGISKEDLPLIFNRYYQATNRQQQTTGTGIGLALVKNLADLHEADISVQSELNCGTTFSLRLLTNNSYPDAIHEEIAETPDDATVAADEQARQLVLVVEDNAEIVDYIRECLTDTYEVLTASDGEKGYEIACERTPDLVISDVLMPVMDGVALCRTLKQNVLTSHIPVILLTAKTTLQDKADGYDAGADSYMTKPFSGNLLKSRVKNLLQTRPKLDDTLTTFKNKKQLLHESASQIDKDFIERVTTLIEQHIENEELNISFIAGKMNMSHSSLYRKIKALTDLTANEFIRKVRMKVAEQLLLTNKYSINEIMFRVGMNSAGHFRQSFRDEFGVTPSEYLNRLKE